VFRWASDRERERSDAPLARAKGTPRGEEGGDGGAGDRQEEVEREEEEERKRRRRFRPRVCAAARPFAAAVS